MLLYVFTHPPAMQAGHQNRRRWARCQTDSVHNHCHSANGYMLLTTTPQSSPLTQQVSVYCLWLPSN